MSIPFVVFWLLVFLGRGELGFKGVLLAVAVWGALLAGLMATSLPPYFLVAAQVVLDVVLILVVFGRDVRIR